MATLTITKGYASGEILLEADLDQFRTGLHTLFNTDKFDAANFGTMALTATKFSGVELTSADGTALTFGTDSDGTLKVASTTKDLEFNTAVSGCTLSFKSVTKTLVFKTTQVDVPGEIVIGAGSSGLGVLYLVTKYRKPSLVYAGASTVTMENNSATTNQSIVAFPSRLVAVTENLASSTKYRQLNLSSSANGYDSSHTGSASGGRRSGITLTANSWYTVYAVRVRYGTNAGNNFIMVADDIFPSQDNWATLNTRYGDGEWVYLGLIRYGFGVVGSTTSIVPFVYTNKGWCYFTGGDAGVTQAGVTLAQSTANADDTPFYTVADGMSGATIPTDAIPVAQFNMDRFSTSDWAIRDASDVVIWRGGWPDPDLGADEVHGHVVTMGVQVGMDFTQTRVRNGAVDKRMGMTAFCDRYVNVRRHGHGV